MSKARENVEKLRSIVSVTQYGAWVQVSHWPGMPEAIADMAAQLDPPFAVTAEQIEAAFAASDISEQEPFVAMARLGLSFYQETRNE